ncbi:MAG: diguanylate cyclase [Sphingopyxis sp.]|nr:diguanylate cyclase [Sphingopyxis sp.]
MALAVLGALSIAAPVQAVSYAGVDVSDEKIALIPCFKRVAPGDAAAALIDQPGQFSCVSNQRALGSGDYWVRLAVPASVPETVTTLRWNSLWQAHATVYAFYPGGTMDKVEVPSAGSGRFVHIGANYTISLRGGAPPQTVLFRIKDAANMRGILVAPHLASAEHIASVDANRAALYGGFAGLCLALFTYNLMMWRAIRERYLLAYCAMIAACAVYALTSSAALAHVFPAIDNNVRLRLNYAGLGTAAICAVWFARRFLGDALFSKGFDRLVTASAVLTMTATLAFAILSPWQVRLLDRLYFIAFGMMFFLGVAIFVRGWMKGGGIERLFVAIWTLPILVNSCRLLHGFGLIPHNFWLDNATLLAIGFEALFSSMLIGHRIRLMQLDRDAARADEAEARHLADTDELTGLSNRRSLMRAVCPPPERAGLYRLVLIDVDHFKRINDAVGHSAGDAVLQRIARLVSSELRPEAMAARLGGEEFAIFYPTDIADRRYHTGLLERVGGWCRSAVRG